MQSKEEINESYLTWRDKYIKGLEEQGLGRHGYQNCFYGKLLIETFDKMYPDYLRSIQVNKQFITLIKDYSFELRVAYAYEWDKAKVEVATHHNFLEFIDKLKEGNFIPLSKPEIKKLAQLLVQEKRTLVDGFFKKLPTDYLHELATYLEPPLPLTEAAKKFDDELQKASTYYDKIRMFSFKDDEISFSYEGGTHVTLTAYGPFKEWFDKLPTGGKKEINKDYQIVKIDGSTVSINGGPQTPGIQIKRIGDSFLVCNNQTADVNNLNLPLGEVTQKRRENLVTLLAELKKFLQGTSQKILSFEEGKIAFTKKGTCVDLIVEEPFKQWFENLPVNKIQKISRSGQAYKTNADTVVINYGPHTCGIRIERINNNFLAYNNPTTDRDNTDEMKKKNLITILSDLEKALQRSDKTIDLAEPKNSNIEEQDKCVIQ